MDVAGAWRFVTPLSSPFLSAALQQALTPLDATSSVPHTGPGQALDVGAQLAAVHEEDRFDLSLTHDRLTLPLVRIQNFSATPPELVKAMLQIRLVALAQWDKITPGGVDSLYREGCAQIDQAAALVLDARS